MKKIVLILFFTGALGDLLSGMLGLKEMQMICNPLIMITLRNGINCHML